MIPREYCEIIQQAQQQKDPLGYDAHQPGAKLDAGKPRLGLVLGDFALALQAVGDVGTFGANKYSDHGWLSVPNGIERYKDALYRHLMAYSSGDLIDVDSGLTHLSQIAWNALAVLELTIRDARSSR